MHTTSPHTPPPPPNGHAVAVLRALSRASGQHERRSSNLQQLVASSGHNMEYRARLEPSGTMRVLEPVPTRDVTFLTQHFGSHRVLVVEADELAPPRVLELAELTYELVASKGRSAPGEPACWHYVLVKGVSLPPLNLTLELQLVADFASVSPLTKQAARLELLCSRVSPACASRLPASSFEVVYDLSPAGAQGAAMADGCGFAPEWLVQQLAARAGALDPQQACALQVRVYSPSLGIFKGMLMRRPGLQTVVLPLSMRKVRPVDPAARARLPRSALDAASALRVIAPLYKQQPSPHLDTQRAQALAPAAAAAAAAAAAVRGLAAGSRPDGGPAVPSVGATSDALATDDTALVLVKLVHPSRANVLRTRPHLRTRPRKELCASSPWLRFARAAHPPSSPAPPSSMILRLWAALGVPAANIERYCERARATPAPAQLSHASLSGVADPFSSLPAGTVFAPGVPGERIFVTRFPCVKPEDGRVLSLVTARPPSMQQAQWAWLQALPFGLLVFSVRGDRPLPEICGQGDLDGDLYFTCWDEELVLSSLTPRPVAPNPRAKVAPAAVAADAKASSTALAPGSSSSSSSQARSGPRPSLDLEALYGHMTHPQVLHASREIGQIYRLWEATVKHGGAGGMDLPDALVLGDAYIQALNAGKHGGSISLPPHLRELLRQAVARRTASYGGPSGWTARPKDPLPPSPR